MSWPIRLIPAPTNDVGPDGKTGFERRAVGDAWFEDRPEKVRRRHLLSPEHAGKRALVLVLPCGTDFAVYGPTWTAGQAGAKGWVVAGDPPRLTLTPSVNIGGGWHGHIRDGVISDDVSGIAFPAR